MSITKQEQARRAVLRRHLLEISAAFIVAVDRAEASLLAFRESLVSDVSTQETT